MSATRTADVSELRVQLGGDWSAGAIDPDVMAAATAWVDAQLVPAGRWHPPQRSERRAGVAARRPDGLGDRLGATRTRPLARSAVTIILLVVFNAASASPGHLAARVYALAFLLLVPGAAALALSSTRLRHGAVRVAAAAIASVFILMATALTVDLVLPRFGITEPLAWLPLLVAVDVVVVALLVAGRGRRDPVAELLGPSSPTTRQLVAVGLLVLVPAASAAGSQAVLHGRGSALATSALVTAGALVIAVVVAAERLPEWFVRAAIYLGALAVVYSFTFSGDRLFGWDIQQEYEAFAGTASANTWYSLVDHDAYRAMLSITALPVALVRLTGVSGESLFRGVYPLLFASFPVMIHVVASRWCSRTAAAAAAAFVVVQLAFAQQLPAIARQEIALAAFGVLVAIAFDDDLPVAYRRVVVVVAGAGLAVTHYSTAYVTSIALVGAWALGAAVRLVRRERRARPVLTLPVVIAVLGCAVLWNFGITRSGSNVARVADEFGERGLDLLPSGEGGSLVTRWLSGNAPQRITGEEYARRLDLIYDQSAPWLNAYPDDVVAAHPVVDDGMASTPGLVPSLRPIQDLAVVVTSQAMVALTGLGALALAWRRRRSSGSVRELAALGVVMLGFVGAMRVSGVAAEAYNQERAQIHVAAVLSVGFAAVIGWFLARWRRSTLLAVSGGLAVVFLVSSGLAPTISGGAASANLALESDARERFAVGDAEVAAVTWLADHRNPDSIVTADRYGKLRVWASAVPIGGSSLQGALTPATLDRNSYVFATEANVVGGRARGAIGADYTVYEFPREFLDATKATIYSTGTTVIYR